MHDDIDGVSAATSVRRAHLADEGIHRATFRSIARALGISTMPLIASFGTKDNLLAEVVAWSEARQLEVAHSVGSGLDALERYWQWTTAPDNLKYVRLEIEIVTLASREPGRFGSARKASYEAWLGATRDLMERLGLDRSPPGPTLGSNRRRRCPGAGG